MQPGQAEPSEQARPLGEGWAGLDHGASGAAGPGWTQRRKGEGEGLFLSEAFQTEPLMQDTVFRQLGSLLLPRVTLLQGNSGEISLHQG